MGEQVELLVLDAIFHIAPVAIELTVEIMTSLWQVGNSVAPVAVFVSKLDFDDFPALFAQTVDSIVNAGI